MAAAFDPSRYQALLALGERLRELAGDTAYGAGRDYLRQGMIKDGTVTGLVARAVVSGSTDYQVTISFDGEVKVICTCPAHRRKRHCKHVVAVCVALLEQPKHFRIVAQAEIPQVAPAGRKRREGVSKQRAEALKLEQRRAGLILVDRLLDEIAAGGAGALGREQVALLTSAAETVRALKLRRLGNRLMALRHFAADGGQTAGDPARFAALLTDICVTRQVLGAYLDGTSGFDPALAEELVGKTWRERELARLTDLELMAVAEDVNDDGEFRIESTYLVDLPTGEVYVERQITPRGLRGERRPPRRLRLFVDEAGVYPGEAPRRLKLLRVRRASVSVADVRRIVERAVDEVAEIRRRLIERVAMPVGAPELAVVFRPEALVAQGDRIAATDRHGRALPLDWPAAWSKHALGILPDRAGGYALVGLAGLGDHGPELRCLGIVGELRWANGPTYPDLA
ncbi:MAG TPA: hypothetical protein VH482_36390 [Thermomicrobiales bacterium]|jgi:hypothetical protein